MQREKKAAEAMRGTIPLHLDKKKTVASLWLGIPILNGYVSQTSKRDSRAVSKSSNREIPPLLQYEHQVRAPFPYPTR